ncbi:MAG: hypothetical protein IJ036_04205 [Lachnospiraceae bacterium]|nr:hypothetical protein [Lachnospiraceae bacterium]
MDKYEFKIKAEQMQRLVERKDYKRAGQIADGIDWRRVKNVELLTTVSEIYEKLERYEDSYEILNMAYDRVPIGRMIVYKMVEMATIMGDFEEAISLYQEFVNIAPHDLSRYVLKYKIYQAKGAPLSDQIAILEEFKSREYHEKWAYELALLYYKEGMSAKCVEECDDLVLWFSEGEYVRRALELKMRVQPLTAAQEEKYRSLMRMSATEEVTEEAVAQAKAAAAAQDTEDLSKTRVLPSREEMRKSAEQIAGAEPAAWKKEDIQVRTVNPEERYNTMNLQEELAAGLKDWLSEETDLEADPEAEAEVEAPAAEEASAAEEAPAAGQKEPRALRLGQMEDGQLTFNEEENVLERQITGQLTIDSILAEWEIKRQQMEAKLAQLAKEEEERKAAEALRLEQEEQLRREQEAEAASRAAADTDSLIPPDVQKLLEEIERKHPVRIIVEPIERTEPVFLQEPEEEPVAESEAEPAAEPEAIDEIPAEAEDEAEAGLPDIDSEVEDDLPEELDEIQAILTEALEEEPEEAEAEEPEREEPEEAQTADFSRKEAEPASVMVQDLERMLEEELKGVHGQRLTEEQEKLFAYFTAVHGMNQQLSKFLEDEKRREKDGTSVAGNLVVTGEKGTGKTTLAIDMVKAVQKQRRVKASKMAKITGEDLSRKDIAAVVRKMNGGALVVEHAGGLTTEAAAQLSGAMLGETGNLFVILEDEPLEIQQLFERSESLAAKFAWTIKIPVFTNNELVAFGKSYAQEQGFVLDEMAVLALYNRIGNNQTSDHLVNVAEVKEMIDEAVLSYNRRGRKLFAKRRQDEFGNCILMERDFEI